MMFYVINFLSYLSPRKSSQTYTLSIFSRSSWFRSIYRTQEFQGYAAVRRQVWIKEPLQNKWRSGLWMDAVGWGFQHICENIYPQGQGLGLGFSFGFGFRFWLGLGLGLGFGLGLTLYIGDVRCEHQKFGKIDFFLSYNVWWQLIMKILLIWVYCWYIWNC